MNKFTTIQKIKASRSVRNKKTILVHGIFDIIHKGHIILFTEAKKIADILIVGLDHDDNAKSLKGKNRPFNSFEARLFVLKHVDVVDYIFEIPSLKIKEDREEYFSQLYADLKPQYIATNLQNGNMGYLKKRQAESLGITFVNIAETYHPNTSELLILGGPNGNRTRE